MANSTTIVHVLTFFLLFKKNTKNAIFYDMSDSNNGNSQVPPRVTIDRYGRIIRHDFQPPTRYSQPQPAYQRNTYQRSSQKSRTVLIILSIFLGNFGVDRFYAGRFKLGIFKALSHIIGIGFIWWLIDVFLAVIGKQKDSYGNYIK